MYRVLLSVLDVVELYRAFSSLIQLSRYSIYGLHRVRSFVFCSISELFFCYRMLTAFSSVRSRALSNFIDFVFCSHNACVRVSFSPIPECPSLQCRNHSFPTPSVHRALVIIVIVVIGIVPEVEKLCSQGGSNACQAHFR